jgi:surfeit locus 1 family protein
MYRKVLLKGRWDHEHSLLLGPRVREGTTGFHLITPLIRENGSTVLVDRGFVPKDSCGGIRARTTTDQEIEVLGLLRTGHARNKFTPDNQPETGIWHWVDLDAMAEYAGGTKADVQAVLVEEIFGKRESIGGRSILL